MECAIPRVNTNVNYGLWAIMMCQCGSSVVTDVPLWSGMLIVGERKEGREGGMEKRRKE